MCMSWGLDPHLNDSSRALVASCESGGGMTKGMSLNVFQQDDLRNDANVLDAFFEILKSTSTTHHFGNESSSTHINKIMNSTTLF